MSTPQDILDFLAPYQILDEVLAQSYENISDSYRALIKQAISFHFSVHKFISPYATGETEQHYSNAQSGLFYAIHKKKTPFLFCAIDNSSLQNLQNTISPALLLSLLCPALLAEVENIFFFFYEKPTDAILTTLELCGIENIFIFQTEKNINKLNNHNDSCNIKQYAQENQINSNSETQNQTGEYIEFFKITSTCLNILSARVKQSERQGKNNYKTNQLNNLMQDTEKLEMCNNEKGRLILFNTLKNKNFLNLEFLNILESSHISYYIENTRPKILASKSQENRLLFAYPHSSIEFVEDMHTNIHENRLMTQSSFMEQKQVASKILSISLENGEAKQISLLEEENIQNSHSICKEYQVSFIATIKAEQNYIEDMELCFIHPTIKIDFYFNTNVVASI